MKKETRNGITTVLAVLPIVFGLQACTLAVPFPHSVTEYICDEEYSHLGRDSCDYFDSYTECLRHGFQAGIYASWSYNVEVERLNAIHPHPHNQ